MPEQDLVSIIIPVHNRVAMLREAVASALAQTYRPIEVLIVDDGSTDDTAAVADSLAAEHDEIQVIHQTNGGPGTARESGRLRAKGAFLQYLDSDDLLLPRKLEMQVEALRLHPECGLAYGLMRYRDPAGREISCDWKDANQVQSLIFPSFLIDRWWETVSPLYRKTVTDAAGPWTSLRLEEDWEYDCRVGSLGTRLAFVGEVLAEHRDHPEGRLSRGAGNDPARLRDRAAAHERIVDHARKAGVDPEAPEFQRFSRELFHIARQCGAAGLTDESRRLIGLARTISAARDLLIFELAARALGWNRAARAAQWIERFR
jgi:hypothetical protein